MTPERKQKILNTFKPGRPGAKVIRELLLALQEAENDNAALRQQIQNLKRQPFKAL
jgi:hypothetical protein